MMMSICASVKRYGSLQSADALEPSKELAIFLQSVRVRRARKVAADIAHRIEPSACERAPV